MATTGSAESAIPPNEPSHVYHNPPTGPAVAVSQQHANDPPNYREVDESGRSPSQHAWPQSLQNVGMHSATPLNNFAARVGSESFMPVTMDKECEKAARILRGFCSKHNPSGDDVPGKNLC
jgi:SH3 domain-containing YSC84-like protein 1